MKKRLFRNLLILCLLLIALTAVVSAKAKFSFVSSPTDGPTTYTHIVATFSCTCEKDSGENWPYPDYDNPGIIVNSIEYPANGNDYHSISMKIQIMEFHCTGCNETRGPYTLDVTFTDNTVYFCHSGSRNAYLNTNTTKTTAHGTIAFNMETIPRYGLQAHSASAPTCTQDGYWKDCSYCNGCKKFFVDGVETTEQLLRPKLGHTYGDPTTLGKCTTCGFQAEASIDDVYYDTFEDALAATSDPKTPIDVYYRHDNKPLTPDKSCVIIINDETVSVSKIQPASDDLTVSIGNYGTIEEIAVAGTMSIYNNCVDYYKQGGKIGTITMPGDGDLTIKSNTGTINSIQITGDNCTQTIAITNNKDSSTSGSIGSISITGSSTRTVTIQNESVITGITATKIGGGTTLHVQNSGSIGTILAAGDGSTLNVQNDAGGTITTLQNYDYAPMESRGLETSTLTVRNGGTITTLSGVFVTNKIKLQSGAGIYNTINSKKFDEYGKLIDNQIDFSNYRETGASFYFPNNETPEWRETYSGEKIENVIVSVLPFSIGMTAAADETSVSVTQNGTGFTITGVTADQNVTLTGEIVHPKNGLQSAEADMTYSWRYANETEPLGIGKTLPLETIQYGTHNLVLVMKDTRYNVEKTASIQITVGRNPNKNTTISLNIPAEEFRTKVYDGTTTMPKNMPIEFVDELGRVVSSVDRAHYQIDASSGYQDPNCGVSDNTITVKVTLTTEGEQYFTLKEGGDTFTVPAAITRYGRDDSPFYYIELSEKYYVSLGESVLDNLSLLVPYYDAERGYIYDRPITDADTFTYSVYHLRPGSDTPDPALDELLTDASVFSYTGDYKVYAVVEESQNYKAGRTATYRFRVSGGKDDGHKHGSDEQTYTDWDGSGDVPVTAGESAARYLSVSQSRVTAGLALSQQKTFYLCLYGKTVYPISASYDHIFVTDGAHLTLSDCTKLGKIKGTSGDLAHVKNGTLSIYDVTLTGGAVVVDDGGELNLYSGEISGNTVTSSNGGAIYIKSGGTANIYGGTIRDNHVYSGNGGAIYVAAGGTLNLYGGKITSNTASGLGGGIYVEAGGTLNVKGAPIVTGNMVSGADNNVYLPTGQFIIVTDTLESDAQIGVSTERKTYTPALTIASITPALPDTQDCAAYFLPDDPNAAVFQSGKLLALGVGPTVTLDGTTLTVRPGSLAVSGGSLFVAEYGADGRMLRAQSLPIDTAQTRYLFTVQAGTSIKCFLLDDNHRPLGKALSPA